MRRLTSKSLRSYLCFHAVYYARFASFLQIQSNRYRLMYKDPFRPGFVGLKKSNVLLSFCNYSVHDAQCPEVFQAVVLNSGHFWLCVRKF